MTNSEYWEKRINLAQSLTDKQVTQRVKKLYQKVYKSIENELMQLWMDMLQEGEVSQSALYKGQRYSKLQEMISQQLIKLGQKNVEYLQVSLYQAFISGADSMKEYLSSPPVVINKEVAKEIVKQQYKRATFSDRVWDDMRKLKERIEDAITQSAVLGKDVRKVAKELEQTLNAGYSSCKRITITETSRVFNEGCRQKAIDEGFDTYHLLIERNACEECKKLKDRSFNLSQSVLPVHPYCKCTMLIDIDSNIDIEDKEVYNKQQVVDYEKRFEKVRELTAKYHIKGIPIKDIPPIDLNEYAFDDVHINQERDHSVTREQAQSYMDNAKAVLSRWQGQVILFISDEGATLLNIKEKLIRTAYSRRQYDDKLIQLMEDLKDD